MVVTSSADAEEQSLKKKKDGNARCPLSIVLISTVRDHEYISHRYRNSIPEGGISDRRLLRIDVCLLIQSVMNIHIHDIGDRSFSDSLSLYIYIYMYM